jgi:predicted NUDIX family phosphoesterase
MNAIIEEIVCFKKELLSENPDTQAIFYDEKLWGRILNNIQAVPRPDAEKDYSFKQLVVYAVIKSSGMFLTYRRTPKTGEERLRSKYSIGIGGHVNIGDTSQLTLFNSALGKGFLLQALWREIREEINIESGISEEPKLVCFINDNSNEVGKVHFGTVWTIEIEKPEVLLRKERGIGKLQFLNIQDLENRKQEFENWSRLLIDYFSSHTI